MRPTTRTTTTRTTTLRRVAPFAIWLAVLALLAAAVVSLGSVLPALPTGTTSLRATARHHGGAVAALAVLRPLLLVALAYEALLTIIAGCLATSDSPMLDRMTRRAPTSVARTIARHTLEVGVAASAVTALAPAAAFAQDAPDPVPTTVAPDTTPPTLGDPIVMVPLDPAPAALVTTRGTHPETANEPSGAAVMVALASPSTDDHDADPPDADVEAPTTTSAPVTSEVSADEAEPAPPPTPGHPRPDIEPDATDVNHEVDRDVAEPSLDATPRDDASDRWTIEPGDHLWAVAAETLTDRWGHVPTDDETLDYWSALLAVNRPRLIDPDNPDLVVPGQVLVLPPVATAIGG